MDTNNTYKTYSKLFLFLQKKTTCGSCKRLCIPFDGIKVADEDEPFFGHVSVSTLEQWGLDE